MDVAANPYPINSAYCPSCENEFLSGAITMNEYQQRKGRGSSSNHSLASKPRRRRSSGHSRLSAEDRGHLIVPSSTPHRSSQRQTSRPASVRTNATAPESVRTMATYATNHTGISQVKPHATQETSTRASRFASLRASHKGNDGYLDRKSVV